MRIASDRGALTDHSIGSWTTQRWILLAYVLIAIAGLLTWGQGFTVVALLAAVLSWAGQWGVTIAFLGLLRTRIGRFFRRPVLIAIVLIVVILVMVVFTALIFGADARIDGWVVVWRIGTTLWISSFLARWSALGHILRQEHTTQEELRALRADNLDAVRTQRQQVVDEVSELMRQTLDTSATDSQKAATSFSQFAREVIRPLSHQIAQDDSFLRRTARPSSDTSSWRQIAQAVTARPALRPWLMATAVFLTLFLFDFGSIEETPLDATELTGVNVLIDVQYFAIALAFHLGIFFVTALSALALQRIMTVMLPRLRLPGRLVFLVATPVFIAIIVELTIQLAYVSWGLADRLSDNFWVRLVPAIAIVVIALLIVINRTVAEVLRSRAQHARDLTDELSWEVSRVQCAYVREQQFFAAQLHGPLQSMLTSTSMRLTALEPHTPQWDAALASVQEDFESTLEQLATGSHAPIDLSQSLQDLRQTWAGVCDIDIAMDDDVLHTVGADWISAGIVHEILIEACANAAIHGRAKNVWIEATWTGDEELQITATNDGSPDVGSTPGLGSAMLDRVAITWSREHVAEGLQLRVVLAIPRTGANTDDQDPHHSRQPA